jgi:hypothetical protein
VVNKAIMILLIILISFNLKKRLNEGFASWVQYLGLDESHPEWKDV